MKTLTKCSLFLALIICILSSCAPSRSSTNMWRDLDHSRQLDNRKGNRSQKIYKHKARNYSKKIVNHRTASNKRN